MNEPNVTTQNQWISASAGYITSFLTVLFALLIFAGRIYTQSYWAVFGLSPDNVYSSLLGNAVVSPNTAIASILIAMTTISLVALFRKQLPDIVGDSNPLTMAWIGLIIFAVGLLGLVPINHVDTASWTPGTSGLVFGLGYMCSLFGLLLWMQASFKFNKSKPSKWEKIFITWLKKIPLLTLQIVFMVMIIATSVWGIADTASNFGKNEAKMMYVTRPLTNIQVDSLQGFEELNTVNNASGMYLSQVKIILETNDLLYFSPGKSKSTGKFGIYAINLSHVKSLNYQIGITPIGE